MHSNKPRSKMRSHNDSSKDQQQHHKLPSKKWVSRISRSRSTSSMPQVPPSPPRPSPPRITPPSPSSRHNRALDDGVQILPQSPSSLSSTPKKSWERHYKSFLRGGKFFVPDRLSAPDLGKDNNTATTSRSKFGKKHNTPLSARRLIKLQQHEHQSGDLMQGTASASPHSIVLNSPTMTLPDLSSKAPRSKSAGFLHPHHTNKNDSAVRGGSLFQSVFHHKRDRSTGSNSNPSLATEEDSSGGKLSSRLRTKSVDTLDSAVHKGYDKGYSPDTLDSAVHKGYDKAYSPDNARFRKMASATAASNPPPLSVVQCEDDATEGSVRGGVPRRSSPKLVKESLLSQKLRNAANYKNNRSKEMKVAFTEFHNSAQFAQDSTSAYLGDEPSQHRNDHFAAVYNQRNHVFALSSSDTTFSRGLRIESSSSLLLEPVTEDVVVPQKAVSRVLCPLLGTETWAAGRRYLIAPAAISMCPKHVMTALMMGNHKEIETEIPQVGAILEDNMEELPQKQYTRPTFPVGELVLGTATVTYVGRSRPGESSYGWSNCFFVLRQNYLFEYANDGSVHEVPRGCCHLQYSTCQAHDNFHDTMHLKFYASPCAKADERTLMIRVKSQQERDWWVSCLTAGAQLTIEDLYEFDQSEKLGHGRYARIFPARKKGKNNNGNAPYDCALKVIDKKEFWYRVQKGRERADTLVREATVQATLSVKCGRLPTFLQTRGFFETCDNVVMELELLEGTDLFRYVSKKGVLTESEAAYIMRDVLTSLDAMQRIGVAHRDVKPANILMCDKQKDGGHVKLGDYGMSTLVGVDGLVRGRCGTPGYVAPEIFSAGVHGGYGNKVDVFSAGVTLYVMLCGYEPFYGESDAELIAANKGAEVEFADSEWGQVSTEGIDLVKRMLEPDPQKRIDASVALKHPWIAKNVPNAPWSDINNGMDRLSLTSADISDDTACTLS